MINSVNASEFLKPKLLPMDKYNSTTTTKLLPPSSLTQTRTFVTISGHQNNNSIDSFPEKQSQFLFDGELKHQDRVRVQHLENHTKLQNNKCWNNFRTLYNNSASFSDISGREMFQIRQTEDDNESDIVNVEQLTSTTITPLHIQNKSAFNLDLNKYNSKNSVIGGNNNDHNFKVGSSRTIKTNNNDYKFYCKQYNNYGLINNNSPTTSTVLMSTEPQSTTTLLGRTEDQNNAYRHIESVHNYAKSKLYEGDDIDITSINGSPSSYLDDEEDDDDEEDNDYNSECDNDSDIDYENRLKSNADDLRCDLDANYEDIFNKRRCRSFQQLSTSSDCAETNNIMGSGGPIIELRKSAHFLNILKDHKIQPAKVNKNKIKECNVDEEVQTDVDVETVESELSPNISVLNTNSLMENNVLGDESAASVKPDHHARRPMNAFLIFCKRHRAIVKERYKNLENRAITKILGDWWASLDTNDKVCFTNLAQQNKDAFFSANPNFKWYKLPAPPLRTLSVRPANDNDAKALEILNNNNSYNNNHSNYFKLADEAQMGDLSQLIEDKSNTTRKCADLHQLLGETSQFMSAHITGNSEALEENHLKRRFYNENSFSSYSSEEDFMDPKQKSARSCKGKRYQELIISGQIATALKKSKSSTRPALGGGGDNSEINIKQTFSNVNIFNNSLNNNSCQKSSVSECESMISYDLNGFDLEEKIKELPALNLDHYLQRKRNTKKKKKFTYNGKKKGQRNNIKNNSNNNTKPSSNDDNITVKTSQQVQVAALLTESSQQLQQIDKQHQQAATAVGSQKRKARKESITRRDVSAIEQEVASLLPLTINGCCYFQEAPASIKYTKTIEKDTDTKDAKRESANVLLSSPIIPSKQSTSSSVSIDVSNTFLNDNMSSSTSDLLILAEVAANRTELKH